MRDQNLSQSDRGYILVFKFWSHFRAKPIENVTRFTIKIKGTKIHPNLIGRAHVLCTSREFDSIDLINLKINFEPRGKLISNLECPRAVQLTPEPLTNEQEIQI